MKKGRSRVYPPDKLKITRYRRFLEKAPDIPAVRSQWEQALRKAVRELPPVSFDPPGRAQ